MKRYFAFRNTYQSEFCQCLGGEKALMMRTLLLPSLFHRQRPDCILFKFASYHRLLQTVPMGSHFSTFTCLLFSPWPTSTISTQPSAHNQRICCFPVLGMSDCTLKLTQRDLFNKKTLGWCVCVLFGSVLICHQQQRKGSLNSDRITEKESFSLSWDNVAPF